jgi:hypothetical protein
VIFNPPLTAMLLRYLFTSAYKYFTGHNSVFMQAGGQLAVNIKVCIYARLT